MPRKLLIGAVIVLVAIVVLGLWGWRQGAERRAIVGLPPAERAELYRRELESFRTLCGHGPREDALQDQCKEKAEFIAAFPECDAACQTLTYSHIHSGRR